MTATRPPTFYDVVYELVSSVPPGRVVTFGQVAEMAGAPRAARAVGYAMAGLTWESPVPWWRVLNVSGAISHRAGPGPEIQRRRLEDEGVYFGFEGRVDLARYRWVPDD